MTAVVLDTCAVVWLAFGDPVRPEALSSIRAAQAVDGAFVSPMSAWEVATKVAKGRLDLGIPAEAWFDRFLRLPGVRLADLTPHLLIASTALPGQPPGDPADRIILATSRELRAPVVTRDRLLLAYADGGHVEAVRC